MVNPQQMDEVRLAQYGQQHLLRYWNDLSPQQRAELTKQLQAVPWESMEQLLGGNEHEENWNALAAQAEGPPAIRLNGEGAKFDEQQAMEAGKRTLERGEVGALLVAGGQATRLNFDHPKGMYPIGPISGASLFQILCEKLLAVGRRSGKVPPLYVMTSPATHDETLEYFAAQNNFGLSSLDVMFFCQGTMPAVDAATGKILMEDKHRLCLSPDGHGGMLDALKKSGCFEDMRSRGLQSLFYFQVDNPLVRMCDPRMLGYHLLHQSQATTKAVAKRSPLDRVGNIVSIGQQVRIIEYSDLPESAAQRRQADGSLTLWAGNTAIHIFDVEFLISLTQTGQELPFHRASKIVPHLDHTGRFVEPEQPNALKFERFIFDVLPRAQNPLVLECDADQEFAAVKKKPGSGLESPEWVQEKMTALFSGWLKSCGVSRPAGQPVEISPLWADWPDEVKRRVAEGKSSTNFYFHIE